jgi:hypothetical protein
VCGSSEANPRLVIGAGTRQSLTPVIGIAASQHLERHAASVVLGLIQ